MKRLHVLLALVGLLCACTLPPSGTPPIAMLGDPAPPSAVPARTIAIRPDTRWVNVTGGDTVRFIEGDRSFAWTFNVASNISSFELNLVAPPGALDHPVQVYVAPDPRYIGGRRGRGGRK